MAIDITSAVAHFMQDHVDQISLGHMDEFTNKELLAIDMFAHWLNDNYEITVKGGDAL